MRTSLLKKNDLAHFLRIQFLRYVILVLYDVSFLENVENFVENAQRYSMVHEIKRIFATRQ
jgi:hypothetical protein